VGEYFMTWMCWRELWHDGSKLWYKHNIYSEMLKSLFRGELHEVEMYEYLDE